MSFENCKTSDPHRLLHNLTDKINFKRSHKYVALSSLSIYYTWKNAKLYKSNRFKVSASTWNDKFELPDGLYSTSDIQDYFECTIKRLKIVADNPPIRIYVNKIENRNTFKTKIGYYLQLLTPETKKLLRTTIKKIIKDKNDENVSHLEITDCE